MWYRVFIPTWRFFGAAGIHPELFIQTTGGPEWRRVFARPSFRWYNLVFNPAGNFYHACNNLLERLLLEATRPNTMVEELVSYKLVEALVRNKMHPHSPFRFKITDDGRDVLMSAELAP